MLKATSSIVNVSQITGVLPVVNGGTGVTTSTGTGSTVLSAAPTLSGNVTLSTGNLIVASGQGIDFSATPGTGTSELLADYEEGTWTPTLTSTGATFAYPRGQFGSYCKIGSLVYAQFYIGADASGTVSNQCIITGLPFSSGNLNSLAQAGATAWVSQSTPIGFTQNNNAADITIWLQNFGSASTATALQVAGGYLVGTVIYRAA